MTQYINVWETDNGLGFEFCLRAYETTELDIDGIEDHQRADIYDAGTQDFLRNLVVFESRDGSHWITAEHFEGIGNK